ncbi:MAG: N-acetylmuramoyl-L-alanine amidase [Paludibacteraceae bacterium]|nr:N-acetylmuramoyl-L-alanine amidase [Paludibacteraceae bacterium]MBR6287593.1 N-acetylmuramoyl-L-alanine amidase [Bacteroidaceae bacterium]
MKTRRIKYIAVHCTASPQSWGRMELEMEFKRKGWKNPGYHFVVLLDGRIIQMLEEEKVSNGVKGYNSVSINVAYVGGIDSNGKAVDNRTDQQKYSMRSLLRILKKKYPDAIIQGHRDFSSDLNGDGRITPNEWIKMCPCFNAKDEYAKL